MVVLRPFCAGCELCAQFAPFNGTLGRHSSSAGQGRFTWCLDSFSFSFALNRFAIGNSSGRHFNFVFSLHSNLIRMLYDSNITCPLMSLRSFSLFSLLIASIIDKRAQVWRVSFLVVKRGSRKNISRVIAWQIANFCFCLLGCCKKKLNLLQFSLQSVECFSSALLNRDR